MLANGIEVFVKEAIIHKKTELQASVNFQNYKYISIPKTYADDLSPRIVKRYFKGKSHRAMFANALDQEVELFGFITFWQLYGRDFYV